MKNNEVVIVVIAQGIQLLSSLIIVKMLTRYLSLEAYGFYGLIIAVNVFVLTVPFTSIQQGFYRFRSQEEEKIKFYFSMLSGVLLLVFIYIITVSFFIPYLTQKWVNILFILILLCVTEIFKIFTRCILNADRKRISYSISILIEFSIKCMGIYFFSEELNVEVVLLIFIVSNIFSSTYSILNTICCLPCFDFNYSLYLWKKVLIFSTPLLMWSILGWMRDMSLRWFIEYQSDLSHIAIFTAISSIAMIIPMGIQSILNTYLIPILYDDKDKKSKNIYDNLGGIISIVFFIGLFFFIVIYIFSDEIIIYTTDVKYVLYAWALPWMYASYLFYTCGMIYASKLLVKHEHKCLFWPNLASAIIVGIGGLAYMNNDLSLIHI